MLPVLATNNTANHAATNAIQRAKCFLADTTLHVTRSYLPNFFITKLVAAMLLTVKSSQSFRMKTRSVFITDRLPTLSNHVRYVIRKGTDAEVCRVTAGPYIACVHDTQPIGNGAIVQFVGKAMYQTLASIVFEYSIASSSATTSPQPASGRTIGFINLRPETLNVFWGIIMMHVEPPIRCAEPGQFIPAPGLLVPNYTTKQEVTIQ